MLTDHEHQNAYMRKASNKLINYNNRLKTNLRRIAAGSLEGADQELRQHIKRKYEPE